MASPNETLVSLLRASLSLSSAVMRAAWEWRGFWAANTHLDLEALASEVAARLGAHVADLAAERDRYVVIPDMHHNLKVRRGVLELKVLLQQLPRGFSQWQDKQKWRFPLLPEDVTSLAQWLPTRNRPAVRLYRTADELLQRLAQRDPRVVLVPVTKRRARLRSGANRLEVAHITLPGGVELFSACADGYSFEEVRDLVRRSGLPVEARPMGYMELLRGTTHFGPDVAAA